MRENQQHDGHADVEHNRPRIDHAPRESHHVLDRAKLKFLGEQAHRDEWEDQNKGEPEKDGIKKRFLHRVLHLTLVHEGHLKIKVHSGDQQEKDEDYVGDRRVEVAAHFAYEQGVKLMHGSISLVPLISNQVRMGELHKHILQRRSTLR